MNIHNFDISKKVLVIAEVGNNHEGNFEVAKELVRAAAKCGVGAVKFQTFKTEHFMSSEHPERYAKLKSFELSLGQFSKLAELAKDLDLLFISTPFDLGSAVGLEGMVDAYKIASGDNTFYPLVSKLAEIGKPLIVSSGIDDIERVKNTVSFIRQRWLEHGVSDGELAMLHCVSSYPVPPEQANLKSIPYLAQKLKDVTVGYSDHTEGVTAVMAAVALGARIIEKHFTLDHNYSDFRDHQLSADPKEMKELVKKVGQVEVMLGVHEKKMQASASGAVDAIGRSIAVSRNLSMGHVVTMDDLVWLRPAGGLVPGEEKKILGKALMKDVRSGDQLQECDVAVVKRKEVVR
jgi:sialic acid synthase SpsE